MLLFLSAKLGQFSYERQWLYCQIDDKTMPRSFISYVAAGGMEVILMNAECYNSWTILNHVMIVAFSCVLNSQVLVNVIWVVSTITQTILRNLLFFCISLFILMMLSADIIFSSTNSWFGGSIKLIFRVNWSLCHWPEHW